MSSPFLMFPADGRRRHATGSLRIMILPCVYLAVLGSAYIVRTIAQKFVTLAAIDATGWAVAITVVGLAVIQLIREAIKMFNETGFLNYVELKKSNGRLSSENIDLRNDMERMRYIVEQFEAHNRRDMVDHAIVGMPGEHPERKEAPAIPPPVVEAIPPASVPTKESPDGKPPGV